MFGRDYRYRQIVKLKNRKESRLKLFRMLVFCLLLLLMVAAMGGAALYFYFSYSLPSVQSLAKYSPPIVTRIFAADGKLVGEYFKERRDVVPVHRIPPLLVQAFIASEDAKFFRHEGIDFQGVLRAFIKNIKAGDVVQGGSTITQQVTKSFLLSRERKIKRKVQEAILARRIEQNFSKEHILYLYLNQIYLGHGAYGVVAAAHNYFGKKTKELNLAEMAMLAGLPSAPSKYSPYKNFPRAKVRQRYVLNRMLEEGNITKDQLEEALSTRLDIKSRRSLSLTEAPYFVEHIRRYLVDTYGEDTVYREGLQVYITMDPNFQRFASESLQKGLRDLDRRQGYRGPLSHVEPEEIEAVTSRLEQELEGKHLEVGEVYQGVVTEVDSESYIVWVNLGSITGCLRLKDMAWARPPDIQVDYNAARVEDPAEVLSVGDVIQVRALERPGPESPLFVVLEQEPLGQAAIISMEPDSGFVRAMVGGYDFQKSSFNRAIQAKRQPGSAFKPIVYAAALDKGYTPATTIIDSPIVYHDTETDLVWKPENYGRRFQGALTLRYALARSINLVTIKLLQDIGVSYVVEYTRNFGITFPLEENLSLALGSSAINLLELTAAYSVFAASGVKHKPVFITKVVDRNGKILESFQQEGGWNSEEGEDTLIVMSPQKAYQVTSMLEGVVQNGTGWRAKALGRPSAGKTGTTNDYEDAWYIGYTPELITGVWVGFDEERPLGKNETGSRAACPIWLEFMQNALEGKTAKEFPVPEGIVFVKVDSKTGLLANPRSEEVIFECFEEGTEPTEGSPSVEEDLPAEEFFKYDLDG